MRIAVYNMTDSRVFLPEPLGIDMKPSDQRVLSIREDTWRAIQSNAHIQRMIRKRLIRVSTNDTDITNVNKRVAPAAHGPAFPIPKQEKKVRQKPIQDAEVVTAGEDEPLPNLGTKYALRYLKEEEEEKDVPSEPETKPEMTPLPEDKEKGTPVEETGAPDAQKETAAVRKKVQREKAAKNKPVRRRAPREKAAKNKAVRRKKDPARKLPEQKAPIKLPEEVGPTTDDKQ
jgi:hypothetical protein